MLKHTELKVPRLPPLAFVSSLGWRWPMPPRQGTVAERRGGGGINGGPGSKQASAKGPPHQQRGGAGGRASAAQQQQQLRQEEAEVRDMLDMVLEFLVHAGFEETVATLKKQLRDRRDGKQGAWRPVGRDVQEHVKAKMIRALDQVG